MSEPRRLLEDEGTDSLARELIEAMRDDAPSDAARAAAANRIGLAPSTPPVVAAQSSWLAGKILLAVAVCAAGGVAAYHGFAPDRPDPRPPYAPVSVAPAATPEPIAASGSPGATISSPSEPPVTGTEPPPSTARKKARPAPTDPTVTAAPTPGSRRSLPDELAVVDSARAALASRDWRLAINLLEVHARDFPDGALAPEAAVLRIEVLLASGDHRQAATRAEEFLVVYPRSALATRVRTMLATARAREGDP